MGQVRRANSKSKVLLIVEDDPNLRTIASEFLLEAGHTVLVAGSVDEAIITLANRPDIDLLFSDIQMPESMDGFGLAIHARNKRPGLQILLTSGATCPGLQMLPTTAAFLSKPYSLYAVRALIDRL